MDASGLAIHSMPAYIVAIAARTEIERILGVLDRPLRESERIPVRGPPEDRSIRFDETICERSRSDGPVSECLQRRFP